MKKKLRSLIAVLFLNVLLFQGIGQPAVSAHAPDEPSVRIGVLPAAQSVTVGAHGPFSLVDKETGTVLFSGQDEEVLVELAASAGNQTSDRLQVTYTTSAAFLEDWLQRAKNSGYPTYIEPYNGGHRLFLGEFTEDAPPSERAAFKNKAVVNGLAGSDAFWKTVTTAGSATGLKISKNGAEQVTSHPVQVIAESERVKINGKTYRGLAEVGFNSSGALVGINELPVEEYLYGVVPRELSPLLYNELEAHKSQAVAARTYALANLGKRSTDGYDLLPTTADQVYGGFEAEYPLSTQAVNGTRGIVATYEGQLIMAVYHSASGGFTASNEDVWDSAAIPYLRATHAAQKGNSLAYIPALDVYRNSDESESLRRVETGDFEAGWSDYYRWNFEWTAAEISRILSAYYNTDTGKVLEINVLKRSASGRATEIEFVTENGTFYEYKDRIRSALQYIDASGNSAALLSTLFIIEPITDEQTGEVTGFKANGGGWGHGVGMSQTGAVGMAERGYPFDVILKHFYRGIDLETKY